MSYSSLKQERAQEIELFYECHARATYSGSLKGNKPKEIPAALLNKDDAKIPEEVHRAELENLVQ